MLRRLALVLVLACLPGVALAEDALIWVEGEKAEQAQLEPNAGLDNTNPDELSGGAWICGWAHENKPHNTASFTVEAPAGGKYFLWVRAFGGTGLEYTLDDKEPVVVDIKKGIDAIPVAADGSPFWPGKIAWFNPGSLELTAGKHKFTWFLGGTKGKDRYAGLDCFVLTTGAFSPNGKYKPTDKAPSAMTAYEEGKAWDFKPPVDKFDPASLLDLRNLNEKEAGEHGFIKTSMDGNNFVRGDGQPIRFWAVLSGPDNAPIEKVKEHARFLAKRGVNIVRLFSGIPVTKAGAKITDVDEKFLDQYFKTVAALKSAGIYTMASPYWPAVVKAPESWGIPGYKDKDVQGLLFFDPKMQEGYKAWMKELYTRKNPYTGLTLAEDPAMAIIQFQNEDSLLFWTFHGLGPAHIIQLRQLYGQFLEKKYGSYEKAREAWQNYKSEFMADEWDKDMPGLQHVWDLTRDGRAKKGKAPGYEARSADQLQFLTEIMRQFNADMITYFREELGCKSLINPGNWRTVDPVLCQDAEYWSYMCGDVVARNIYAGGLHSGVNSGWIIMPEHYYTDVSMIREPVKLPTSLRMPVGKPFIIPETLWTPPDLYQSEGPLLVAAQMSLSGMNGAFWSVSGLGGWADSTNYKWSWNTPMLLGQFPAAALIYRQGLVEEGQPAVVEHRALQNIWDRKVPVVPEESGWDPNRDTANMVLTEKVRTAADPLAYLVGPVRVVYDSDPNKTEVADLARYIDRDKKIARSITGQIETDWGKGIYRVDAPQVQAAAGFLRDAGPQKLSDVEIACANAYAAIVVVSLDGKPIKESSRVLVQVGTTCRPSGWKVMPTGVKYEGKQVPAYRILATGEGKLPFQVENAAGTVTVANKALTKAVLLDVNGMPTDSAVQAIAADGKLAVTLPANAMYLVLE
ncbi:MAG: hypothetical protein ABSE73_10905 [Planctomycetota bacterium]